MTALAPSRVLLAVLLFLPPGAEAVELRRGPYLQAQRPDGVTVRWRTDDSSEGPAVVRYGTSPNNLDKAAVAGEVHKHFPGVRDWSATIDGLEPGSRYFYSVEVAQVTLAGADEGHTFRTAPRRGRAAPLRFWLMGDSGSNRPRKGAIGAVLSLPAPSAPVRVRNGFRKFNAGRPLDGIILLGDNAYPRGSDSEYQAAFFGIYRAELASTALWPCVGNHDLDDVFRFIFTVPSAGQAGGVASASPLYYSFDIANVHVVMLDPWKSWWETTTALDHPGWVVQKEWLAKDLAANRADWTIVVNHFPLYCDGDYDSDSNGPLKILREEIGPLLESHGADVVLAGHDHTYQRSYLIDGHHGTRDEFEAAKHRKSASDGRTAPMTKKHGPNNGTVYVVSGTGGGSRKGGKFAHPVMVPFGEEKRRGLTTPGSFLLEIDGFKLTGTQVDEGGEVVDRFVLRKTRP